MEHSTGNQITKNIDTELMDFFTALSLLPKRAKAGRKKILTTDQVQAANAKYQSGEYTVQVLAQALGVSHETLRREMRLLNGGEQT
jgi:hypothetical protein